MTATNGRAETHSATEILAAAAEWVWSPRGSETDSTHLQLVRYPEHLGGGVRGSRVVSTVGAHEILDHAITRTEQWGASRLTVWTSPADAPDLEDELRRRGAEHIDTVTVFARSVHDVDDVAPRDPVVASTPGDPTAASSPGEPIAAVPPGVTAEIVDTLDQLREVDAIDAAVWGQTPLDEDGLRAELADTTAAIDAGSGARVLARIDGRAVSTGGCTIVDGFVRLWGAGTLDSMRGRGAYRAVLAERLRAGARLGARTALVKGRVSTSAPILARSGFRSYGEERCWLVRM